MPWLVRPEPPTVPAAREERGSVSAGVLKLGGSRDALPKWTRGTEASDADVAGPKGEGAGEEV